MRYIDYEGDKLGIPSKNEFRRRVKSNLSIMSRDRFDFINYEFFDLVNKHPKNIHTDILSKSINDIRGAIPIGHLAMYAAHGADAIMIRDGKFVETELKTIEVDESRVVITNNNEIYYGSGKSITNIIHALKIQFVVTNDYIIRSKNRPTFVILRSRQTGKVIDAWELDGDIIEREIRKGDPSVASKAVSLAVFLKEGTRTKVVVDHTGWKNWCDMVKGIAVYEIRRTLTEDIIKKFAAKRNVVRTFIKDYRIIEKRLGSKISQGYRLKSRVEHEIKKLDESIDSYIAFREKVNKKVIEKEKEKKNLDAKFEIEKDKIKRKSMSKRRGVLRTYLNQAPDLILKTNLKIKRKEDIKKDKRNRIARISKETILNENALRELLEKIDSALVQISVLTFEEETQLSISQRLRKHLIRS